MRTPFEGTNILAITNAVVNKPPPALPEHYSDNIKKLTESLLSKQPTNRPLPSDVLHAPVFSAVLLELLRLEIAKPSDLPPLEIFSPGAPDKPSTDGPNARPPGETVLAERAG